MMRTKAKKTPMCSVSLIAIELKGLVAPGEALKNKPLQEEGTSEGTLSAEESFWCGDFLIM